MRLLNVRSLQVQEFISDQVPSYAIASHRWLREEVDLRQLSNGEKRNTPSFEKIRRFCQFIIQRMLTFRVDWIWIDNICIDRTNAVELQEAITSMYRFYQNATVCLAYLHDVDSEKTYWRPQFSQSEWFKRGWTLQELLAPRVVLFLDKDWNVLGHKVRRELQHPPNVPKSYGQPLHSLVSETTGISPVTLNQTTFDPRQVLMWMHNRQTTRHEDRAYSLLGICGISMSLRYGEREKATERLLKKLSKTYNIPSDDPDILREAERAAQLAAWQAPPTEIFIAVMGETGVGKSNFINLCKCTPEASINHGLTSATSPDIQLHRCQYSSTTIVWLIDTPGANDVTRSDDDVLGNIVAWLANAQEERVTLDGIIYLNSITRDRFTGTSLRSNRMTAELIGSLYERIIFATTFWDQIASDLGHRREQEWIKLMDTAWKREPGPMARLHNDYESAMALVGSFVRG